ncbi:GNAT family N-acetyltransferase [Streptomyces sp. NPDC021212]|uniref:GNAT family N-acetyltransferase n=1 Tax=Streptomyces sp. NPDC021212 TaxID=3365118 RepID=UPI0037B7D65E
MLCQMTSNSTAQAHAWWPTRLETARLTLRPVATGDLTSVERLWRDERVRRYLGGPVPEAKIALRRERLPGLPGAFATEDRTTAAFIGLVTVEPGSPRGGTEISYTLLPEWWGHGLGREAVAAAVEWARKLPGDFPVVAVTQSANTGSRRLLEAIGLSSDGEVVEYGEPQTVYRTASPAQMQRKSNT